MRPAKLTALLTAAVLLGVGTLGAAPAFASRGETVFFEAPSDLLSVSATTRARTLAKLESLGVHALRIVLYWRDVAPSPRHRRRPSFNQADPAAYHWGAYDQLIKRAAALHWTVLLTVSGPVPRWATPHGEDQYSDPGASAFGLFMRAVGKHYRTRVKLFAIWNEPNQPGYLRPQYAHGQLASAAIYRRLFLAGYRGLQASGNFSGMHVLMGETSPVGVRSRRIPAPLAFLRGVLCLDSAYRPLGHCATLPADGYAQHPYSESQGSFWIPPTDDVTIGTIGRLVTALDRAAAVGAIEPRMAVYITEFGVQSYPNRVQGLPLRQQAEFDAMAERIAWSNPRIASFAQYLLRDDHPVDGYVVGFQSGLETYNGQRKPVYQGFRLPLVVTRTRTGVSFWGLARPARAATRVVLQYSSNGGRSWRGLAGEHTEPSGAWTAVGRFVARRMWRVGWVSAGGQTVFGAPTRAYTSSGRIDY
jgi:hypothetical protein